MEGTRKYCVPRGIGRMIEPARDQEEAWRIMESYFNRETRMLDSSIDEILGYGRMVNNNQTLAHYSRILLAIRDAKQLGRLSDLLTDKRINALMEIVPRKENGYWRHDQVGVRPKDRPVAFYSFVRLRALELGSNTSPFRFLEDDPEEPELAWEGPCLMGDLCGGSHAPEKCSLFVGLSSGDRLVVVEKKRLCYLCFRHADSQPCKLQSSLPACSVGGCLRMHSKLLHKALQKEETRAIVIEVDDGPEEPGQEEEFYAANFELLGQEDEDEVEGMVSEDEAPPLVSSEGEPDEEPSPYAHLGEDRPRLCQQRVPLEVNGNLTSLHTLYDWESPNTLVRIESARRIGLQGMRAPRQAIKGYQGVGTITDSVYYLPLLDADGNIQVIRAHGVEEIAIVARTRLPPIAREIFPVIRASMPWMETGAGHVELLIGLDNRRWLPAHVEDSWDPDDDMRLMRSVFGHRYMITDGWGRDLLPPDNAPGSQAGAQGGAAEQADAAQEVQLPEYRGWSQGTWNPGSAGGSSTTNQRGGCLGARPKTRGIAPSRGAPPTRRPGTEARDPPAPQIRIGAARPQALRGARPRLRVVPPPRRRPAPSPPPAPGQGTWDWLRSIRGSRGQRGASRRQPPRRPPSPGSGRVPGPLQLMGPGDHPMQKLALMMAVMMLGMSPAHGCSTSIDLGSQGAGGQAEMMFPPSARSSSDGEALMTEGRISSTALRGDPPVEPGVLPVRRILQQIQLGVEVLVKIKNEVLRAGQGAAEENPEGREYNPGSGENGQGNRPKREAAQRETEALKKGADATRGRGQRRGRLYQRAGTRN